MEASINSGARRASTLAASVAPEPPASEPAARRAGKRPADPSASQLRPTLPSTASSFATPSSAAASAALPSLQSSTRASSSSGAASSSSSTSTSPAASASSASTSSAASSSLAALSLPVQPFSLAEETADVEDGVAGPTVLSQHQWTSAEDIYLINMALDFQAHRPAYGKTDDTWALVAKALNTKFHSMHVSHKSVQRRFYVLLNHYKSNALKGMRSSGARADLSVHANFFQARRSTTLNFRASSRRFASRRRMPRRSGATSARSRRTRIVAVSSIAPSRRFD